MAGTGAFGTCFRAVEGDIVGAVYDARFRLIQRDRAVIDRAYSTPL
jgi:hypothetical protein